MSRNDHRLQRAASLLLRLEWIWIAAMALAYWHISGAGESAIRDRYVFLLIFALPIYGLRWLAHRRLFTGTALDLFFLLFVQVSLYNFHNAPQSRADYLVIVCRYFLRHGVLGLGGIVGHLVHTRCYEQ